MNLILGTANFGNPGYGKSLGHDECFKILDRAKELGVWAVDTARSYGDSEDIILDWDGGLKIFSKYKGKEKYPEYADYVLLHNENEIGCGMENDGASLYSLKFAKEIHYPDWIQAPLNPINYEFLPYAKYEKFIARSIFCGGKLQKGDFETVAKLVFGFLKSHGVMNVCFGVESMEELELIVGVVNEK